MQCWSQVTGWWCGRKQTLAEAATEIERVTDLLQTLRPDDLPANFFFVSFVMANVLLVLGYLFNSLLIRITKYFKPLQLSGSTNSENVSKFSVVCESQE